MKNMDINRCLHVLRKNHDDATPNPPFFSLFFELIENYMYLERDKDIWVKKRMKLKTMET